MSFLPKMFARWTNKMCGITVRFLCILFRVWAYTYIMCMNNSLVAMSVAAYSIDFQIYSAMRMNMNQAITSSCWKWKCKPLLWLFACVCVCVYLYSAKLKFHSVWCSFFVCFFALIPWDSIVNVYHRLLCSSVHYSHTYTDFRFDSDLQTLTI